MLTSKPLFLVVVLVQFLVPILPPFGFGLSIGDRAVADGIPPELPPGVFFSIWGLIFTGLVLTAIWHLRSASHASTRIAPPLMLAALGNSVWMLCAQSIGVVWIDFLLLLPIAFCTWEAAYRLDQTQSYDGTPRAILHGLTVGLFAGWLTIAVSISVPDLGRFLLNREPSDAVWQSLWMTLVPATLMALVFANFVSRNGWYFVALGWGLIGIVANNWGRTGTHWLAIATAIIGAYILFRRMRFGARGSYPAKL